MMKNTVTGRWKSSLALRVVFMMSFCLGIPWARTAEPNKLPIGAWAAKIHGGWVGKVAAGSRALPTENWKRERIREKYGELSTPPQTPTSRGPLDDTTLSILVFGFSGFSGFSGFTVPVYLSQGRFALILVARWATLGKSGLLGR